MPGTGGWLSPNDAAWGQGTRVTPWEVAGAGTHLPSSAGHSGEQDPALAVSGCRKSQEARRQHARFSCHRQHASMPGMCLTLWRGCWGGQIPKHFPP